MNIKKIAACAAAAVLVGCFAPVVGGYSVGQVITASAEEEGTYEQLTYLKYDDHVEITGCDGDVVYVEIPAEIDGLSVTAIEKKAFLSCSYLTSITIPDSVTSIGDNAFFCCNSLKSVTIPDSVTSIGYNAFYFCHSLTSIVICNPDCDIVGFDATICNYVDANENLKVIFTGTIYGCEGSTAQEYADTYGYNFDDIKNAPVEQPEIIPDKNDDTDDKITDKDSSDKEESKKDKSDKKSDKESDEKDSDGSALPYVAAGGAAVAVVGGGAFAALKFKPKKK